MFVTSGLSVKNNDRIDGKWLVSGCKFVIFQGANGRSANGHKTPGFAVFRTHNRFRHRYVPLTVD